MVICAEFSNLEFSNIFSILSYSDIFIIFLFSHFLSFSLLDLYKIKLNYLIILSTAIFCQIDLCRHTNRLWLPLFFFGSLFVGKQRDCAWLSFMLRDQYWWAHNEIMLALLFSFCINIYSTTLSSYCYLLAHMTGMSALL